MLMGRVEARPVPLVVVGLLLLYLLVAARGGGKEEVEVHHKEEQREEEVHQKNPHPYTFTLNPGASVCGEERVDILVSCLLETS